MMMPNHFHNDPDAVVGGTGTTRTMMATVPPEDHPPPPPSPSPHPTNDSLVRLLQQEMDRWIQMGCDLHDQQWTLYHQNQQWQAVLQQKDIEIAHGQSQQQQQYQTIQVR
jgi:hypothetical protein